jgi:hypothetical protein
VPRGSFQSPPPGPDGFPEHVRFIVDQLNRGVVLLDKDGQVLDANACALELIRARDGLVVRSGRLAFSDKAVSGRVAALLEAMGPPGGGVGDERLGSDQASRQQAPASDRRASGSEVGRRGRRAVRGSASGAVRKDAACLAEHRPDTP